MPSTTTNRNYPYPVGTDPIDTAGDIERLAKAIDTDISGGSGSGGSVGGFTYTQDLQPAGTIKHGAMWHDTSTGLSYVFVIDANSSQWVQFAPSNVPPNVRAPNMPWGLLARAYTATPQGGFPTTPTAIALSCPFTPDPSRLYEITSSIAVAISSGSTVATGALICSGGVGTLMNGALQLPGNGNLGYLNFRTFANFTAGAKTLTYTLAANAGTITHAAAATAPSLMMVIDIGPVPS